ncbi:stalk domain-containing protein [Natranaerofaba carboxydovora]|uniref:stalk domain-containing protein n=1 Tax=Natranaerofaba carboxydovora TaxID=2742683 RepID=UPI001F13AF33|nr:stalk domain-containing protein [Natranaerofaba carboxydovora]UMZ74695.1 hypothetical protein ACONDI_02295 [Natranaerofaba carboxydovora]
MKNKSIILISVLVLFAFTSIAFTEGLANQENMTEEMQERRDERLAQIEEFRQNQEIAQQRDGLPLEDKIFVRGQQVSFDVPPMIEEDRTLIPLRAVSEALDADVEWIDEERKVVIERDDKLIEMIAGEEEVEVDGDIYEIEVPSKIIEERTMVPLRFVSEILGDSVDYHEETGEIDIALNMPDSPADVVNDFWELYKDGELDDAKKKVVDDRVSEIIGMDVDMDGMEETEEAIDERLKIEAAGYEIQNDTAIVDILLTKPDLKEAVERYYDEATLELWEMYEEGANDAEIEERADELLTEILEDVDVISYDEKVELHKVDEEWKIYELIFENFQERWSEAEEDLEEVQ